MIIKLNRRKVYRGDVYNAIEGERINVLPNVLNSKYMDGVHDGLKRALSILANDVSDIPAADVVEVRHGHYICRKDEFGRLKMICSACGEETGMSYRAKKEHMHYCPNCGARMDMEDAK